VTTISLKVGCYVIVMVVKTLSCMLTIWQPYVALSWQRK